MYGGTGNDTYIVDSPYDVAVEFAGQGTDTVRTSTHYALDYGSSIERLEVANPLSTNWLDLIGNELNNTIVGNNGRNSINGGPGADTLIGGGGNDVLRGDAGNDTSYRRSGYGHVRLQRNSEPRHDHRFRQWHGCYRSGMAFGTFAIPLRRQRSIQRPSGAGAVFQWPLPARPERRSDGRLVDHYPWRPGTSWRLRFRRVRRMGLFRNRYPMSAMGRGLVLR